MAYIGGGFMASTLDFVDHVYEQISSIGNITYKKMFGEYGFYYDGKFFACVRSDNQFFIKYVWLHQTGRWSSSYAQILFKLS